MNRLVLMSTLVAAILVAAVVAVMYSSGGAERAKSAQEPSLAAPKATAAAKPFPAPKGEPVLRMEGVARGNVSAHVTEVDFATLDQAASKEITIREPFIKRQMTFNGIPMDELLRRAGADPSARKVRLHALDEYHVELPVADLRSAGLLATRADGRKMPIAKGGPIRLVFTGDGKTARDSDNWIWSVNSIRVKR